MNKFNYEEFLLLRNKYNAFAYEKEVCINYDDDKYFNQLKKSVIKDRKGEVVFCVISKGKKIISITCDEYPSGIFRIPTGGISHNEDIIDAVHREVYEELGLKVDIREFIGAIKIKFTYKNDFFYFYSYLFILDEVSGNILIDATDNEVSQVFQSNISELQIITDKLNKIHGTYEDWGKFRFITTGAILEYLELNPELLEEKLL